MLLTIFTPAYNRKHTITRTYESLLRQTCKDFNWLIIDDGSSDGTREWVLSLGNVSPVIGQEFDWMGRQLTVDSKENNSCNHFIVDANGLQIEYIYKPNGGLYTGYNVAYATIKTELCVCIDSDDYAPDDMVEKVCKRWNERDKSVDYCGIVGLDYNVVDKKPIGGKFTDGVKEGYYADVKQGGDTKEVMRVDLMKSVAPMIGFEGEKDFNPFYMISQIVDKYPILVENSNFCWVEYQIGGDSMSQAIFKQYIRSPRSYAKYRLNEMRLKRRNSMAKRFKSCIHYVSECMISHEKKWISDSPYKLLTIIASPFACMLNIYIRYKAR